MAIDPQIALSVNPPAPPPNPLSTLSVLSQLRSASVENALRQQQIQASQAEQRVHQAEADQKNRDFTDQNKIQELQKDPAVNARLHTGDFSDIEGKIQPKNLDSF